MHDSISMTMRCHLSQRDLKRAKELAELQENGEGWTREDCEEFNRLVDRAEQNSQEISYHDV